ncbi:MAG: hypothetical protein J6V55_01950 [Alistipes sp.]|nr:hypothetical protein [Alistipes sp.]
MKRLLATLLFIASAIYTTSCGTIYLDAIPAEVSTMEIPAEGGCFSFKVVDYEEIVPTRFQPGEAIKDYRYRIVEDGIAGEESQSMHEYKIYIVFAPNYTGHTKEYAIDVKIADDFYRYDEEHHYGEWHRVWIITQPSLASE